MLPLLISNRVERQSRNLTGKHTSEKEVQRYCKSQRVRAREGDKLANNRIARKDIKKSAHEQNKRTGEYRKEI